MNHAHLFLAVLITCIPMQATALETATFAGGCFWCVEQAFDEVEGVVSTLSGYANGRTEHPDYAQVSAGGTGHTEALQLRFDPQRVSYEHLLGVFWRNHDPTDGGGQFCDRGDQYRPAIFFHNARQQAAAERSLAHLQTTKPFKAPIVTPIEALKVFYPAEEYHQGYHLKNPLRYRFYKYNCGRAARLNTLWGNDD